MHELLALSLPLLLLPFTVGATVPSESTSRAIESIYGEVGTSLLERHIDTLNTTGLNQLLVSSVSSSTKGINVVVPKKVKKLNYAKSGVTISYPTAPQYSITATVLDEKTPSYGFSFEIGVGKKPEFSSGVGIVSPGVLGLLAWDSAVFGAKRSFQSLKTDTWASLPSSILAQLIEKNEFVTIRGYKVQHTFIDYKGKSMMGMYLLSREVNGVTIGFIALYADNALVATGGQKMLTTQSEAQQLLMTVIEKSSVNESRANKYFQLQ